MAKLSDLAQPPYAQRVTRRMFRLRSAQAILSTLAVCSALGTDISDSLRFRLDSDAAADERARSLIRLSQRTSALDPVGAISYAVNAVRLAETAGDSALVHEALTAALPIQLRLGMRAEYMRTSLRAMRIAKALELPDLISSDLQSIARAYRLNEEPLKAVEEARKSVAITAATENHALHMRAEVFLLEMLVESGLYQEARRCAERAFSLGNEGDFAKETALVRLLLAKSLIAQGRYHDAQPYLVHAERVLRMDGDADNKADVQIALARTAIHMGEMEIAQERLSSLGLLENTADPRLRIARMEAQCELFIARKDYSAAYAQLLRTRALEDSLRRVDRDLILSGTQAMYDMERMDLDNRDLRSRNQQNEEVIADQRSYTAALSWAAFALLLSAVALVGMVLRARRLARRSRLKSKVIERQRDELHAKGLELERQNLRLRESLLSEEQKDIILREIHHRVKNNLQVIDSLLGLHIGDPSDPSASRALRDAQGRIRAMGLVHTAIYRLGGESGLPIREHILELTRLVLAANGRHDSISVNVDVPDVTLHASELMPLSLLLNELLTNSLKYAFKEKAQGQIRIGLRPSTTEWELLFTDDGDCPSEEHAYVRPGAFGMELLQVLARQLNGELSIRSDRGTQVRVGFIPMENKLQKAS